MLRITLYKQCILNETYANVFSLGQKSNKTILEHYLDTLTKKVYEIDYVYQENSGQLVFPFEIDSNNDIYDFNYMKVETIGEGNLVKILRYCFVQEIILKNELVYISYEEDMWHSYAGKITGITESYLNASRIIDYENGFSLKVRGLPFELKGNKPLIGSVLIGDATSSAKFMAVIKMQLYQTDSQGNVTNRWIKYYGIDFTSSDLDNFTGISLNEICQRLVDIEEYKATATVVESIHGFNYELGEIFIFPVEFNIQSLLIDSISAKIHISNSVEYTLFNFAELWSVHGASTGFTTVKEITVPYDAKLISLGTLSSQRKFINNGNSFNVKLDFAYNINGISLYLNFNNELVDITKDFLYTIPVASINSEEMSLLKLQRELNASNIQHDLNLVNVKADRDNQSVWEKLGGALEFGGVMSGLTGIFKRSAEWTGGFAEKNASAQEWKENTDKLNNNLTLNDAPLYTSNKGVDGNYETFLNIRHGILAFYSEPQNKDFVTRAVNNLGFTAYEFISDFSKLRVNDASYFIENNVNYNVIGFKSVSCYGSFARNTARVLNSILESGVKIWYTETMADDGYIVIN